MKRSSIRVFCPTIVVLFFSIFAGSTLAADFTKYKNYDAMTSALQAIADQSSNRARLIEIGKSLDGRSIWVVELASSSGTALSTRPALFIAANFEGSQLFGSELALYIIDSLLSRYSTDESIKDLFDNHVVYVLPRANPDGAEKMFASVVAKQATNNRPMDDDNDGRVDEDGYEDLNGDGIISVMRVRDPSGELMIHPDDSRLMKKADPDKGESGAYKVYWEGVDIDRDGFINEDPLGGVDLNRNFQHKYPYYSVGAGPHMVSENESRAIIDFVIENRNIAAILTFGSSDNLVHPPDVRGELKSSSIIELFQFADQAHSEARQVGMFEVEPPSRQFRFRMGRPTDEQPSRPRRPARKPVDKVNTEDITYFKTVSDRYREITGISDPSAVREPAGAFFEYGYYQFGVPSFSTPGWGFSDVEKVRDAKRENSSGSQDSAQRAAQRPEGPERKSRDFRSGASGSKSSSAGGEVFDLKLLQWLEAENIDGFVEWASFNHEDLGEVEIGGFNPGSVLNPPIRMIEDLGPKHCDFVLYLSSLLPDVSIAETRVSELGGGLFKIEAVVENSGFFPTSLAHGATSRSVKPTMVQLGVEPDNLISGDNKTSFFQALDGSGNRKEFTWIIKGTVNSEVELKVVAQKGGTETVKLTLN